MQPAAISAAVPIATQSAPSASALAASTPLRIPPEAISVILPYMPMSSSARRAAGMAVSVGTPVWSSWNSGEAAVEPSVPSTTIASQPVLAAILTSCSTRQAASLRMIGTR